MGSLTSGPSIPTQSPQIVYVPQPVGTVTTSAPTPASTPDTPSSNDDEVTGTQIRKQNLLGRERSRFGTIKTSFRGVLGLSDNASNAQRKTLLGE